MKAQSQYVGPYKILKRNGKVAYQLELPAELAAVYPVFHISLLKKCVGDPASIVAMKNSLSYEDVPVEILDRQAEYFPPKEDVILQNEASTDLYILVTGAVDLISHRNGMDQVVGELKAGDVCGEVGVLCCKPQHCTV
ncbi:hypothetical protein MTR67_038389 [Solanum verrucosum]|uniref:Cyclic nucleotide-binding domain-containing protein n=1 Tax=Solanum verrucosum TaxID=315347 RepID=A0AAF0ZQ71_SOLVR|nr:hypothetical protein MTR67_038389 [Solanum verrucosum]